MWFEFEPKLLNLNLNLDSQLALTPNVHKMVKKQVKKYCSKSYKIFKVWLTILWTLDVLGYALIYVYCFVI